MTLILSRCGWRFFQVQTIAPGILSPLELDNGFCGIVQPIMVSRQSDQFDGT
jgi:hypothetical protein